MRVDGLLLFLDYIYFQVILIQACQQSEEFPSLDSDDDIAMGCSPEEKTHIVLNRPHRAAYCITALLGHTESVKMILDCLTADQQIQIMSFQGRAGETAIQCAQIRGRTDTLRILREYQQRADNLMREQYSKFIIHDLHVSFHVSDSGTKNLSSNIV